jgi:peptidoglycan/LPS O-acetylase OafA/YrhL
VERRRGDIQGLRAVAVLLVVVYHAGLGVSGGFTGVDVFFVISGFVITTTLVRELGETGKISLSGFYRRRVKRLLPALAVMVVVVTVFATLANPIGSQRTAALTGMWASVFAANGFLYRLGGGYFGVSSALDPFLHTWTLAVEEQFYLLFPALLVIAWRFGRRASLARTAALTLIGSVTVASFFLSVALLHGSLVAAAHRPAQFAFYGSPTRAWEFGAGALVALAGSQLTRIRRRPADLIGAAGATAVLYGAFAIAGTRSFPGTSALYPVLGTAAVIAAGTGRRPLISRALDRRQLVWVGDRSYSWYLWHWPLIVFAKAFLPGAGWAAPAAAAASLLPAAASYRWIENPIRFNRSIRGRRVLALGLLSVLAPIAACAGLLGVQHLLARTAALQAWERSRAAHLDELRGCQGSRPFGAATPAACTWHVRHTRGAIVLIGDSNAGHFSEPTVRAANRAGFDVTIATFDGCPFVDLRVVGSAAGEGPCRTFAAISLRTLLRVKPSLVIIAARSDGYINGHVSLAMPRGPIEMSPRRKAELWRSGLTAVLSRLNRAGVPALVVDPVPEIPWQRTECAVLLVLANACRGTVAQAEVDAQLRPGLVAQSGAIAAVSRSYVLDLEGIFCSQSRCSSTRGGVLLYRDDNHLSVAGSLVLTDRFYRAIVDHARWS